MADRSGKDPHAPWVNTRWPGIRKGTHRETGEVRWRVYYRPDGGYQTSKTFRSLEEARRFRAEIERVRQDARDGRGKPLPNRTPEFERFYRERFLPRYSGSTAEAYFSCLREVGKVDPEFLTLRIGMIRRTDIEIMLARHAERYAPATTNKTRNAVMVALNRAAQDGLIDKPELRIPRRRVQKPPAPPSPDELQLVLAAMPDKYRAPVLVSAAAGLRSGEVRALRVSDIGGLEFDLRAGWRRGEGPYTVSVRVQIDRTGLRVSLPKSQAGQRTIGVIPELIDTVAAHLNRYGFTQVGDMAMLWPMTSESLRRRVVKASEASLGRPLRVHTLRRYFGTQLAYGGVPVHEIQKDLGHTDPAVTMQWYISAMEGRGSIEAKRNAFGPLFQAADTLPPHLVTGSDQA